MRTENQIKRKLIELQQQKQALEKRMSEAADPALFTPQLERLDDMILMLEWVLDAPAGSYHL